MGMRWVPLILVFTAAMACQPLLVLWLPAAAGRFGLTAVQSGLLASVELICLTVVSIAWAALARRGRGVKWLTVALAVSLAANIASFLAPNAATLIVARIVSGAALGITVADVTGQAARTANPHRVFSFQQLGLIAFLFVCFSTGPKAMAVYGPLTPFLYLAAMILLALIGLVWLRSGPEAEAPQAAQAAEGGARPAASAGVILAFAAIAVTFMAQGAIWPYVGDAARGAGVDLEMMGRILAIGAVVNLLAPIASERTGLRLGRLAPLLFGYAGFGVSLLFLTRSDEPSGFTVGAIGVNLFLLFLMPFLLNILAGLDASGRSASAAPALMTLGGAIGPALAGVLIGKAGIANTGAVLAGVASCGLLLAVLSSAKAPQRGVSAQGA